MAGLSDDNIPTYREMLKLDPSSRVFELLAEELCAAGRWEEAVKVCREGLQYHPDHMRPRVLLGLALMELGELEESGRILLEIHGEIQKNSIIFKLLSEFATSSGDPQQSMEFSRIYEAFYGQDLPGVRDGKSELPSRPPGQIELVLSDLAERIESRFTGEGTLEMLFSDSDRDLLKKTILSQISPA